MATSFSKCIELSIKVGYYNLFSVCLYMLHLSVTNFINLTYFNVILVLTHCFCLRVDII